VWDDFNNITDSTWEIYKYTNGTGTPAIITLHDSTKNMGYMNYGAVSGTIGFNESYFYVLLKNYVINRYTPAGGLISAIDLNSVLGISLKDSGNISLSEIHLSENNISMVLANLGELDVKIFSLNGDSITSWVLMLANPSPTNSVLELAITDSFLLAKKLDKLQVIDIMNGNTVYQLSTGIILPPASVNSNYSLVILSSLNAFMILNDPQMRLYHLANTGQIEECVDMDINSYCGISGFGNEFALGKNNVLYWPIACGGPYSILCYKRK
jgi:hypothetical protein